MNFSATVPVASLQAANDALEAQGFGPDNFSVPLYAGPTASFALLTAWGDPLFEAAVAALPDVNMVYGPDPIVTTEQVSADADVEWGGTAPPLVGVVTPGLYRFGTGPQSTLWTVIQTYDTAVYPDPAAIPALVRMAKIPGEAQPWVQPLDQFDAYKLVDPFTGEGDLCTFDGETWYVTQADGAGNNIWQPGVFGWTVVGQTPLDYITYNGDPVFYDGQGVING